MTLETFPFEEMTEWSMGSPQPCLIEDHTTWGVVCFVLSPEVLQFAKRETKMESKKEKWFDSM